MIDKWIVLIPQQKTEHPTLLLSTAFFDILMNGSV